MPSIDLNNTRNRAILVQVAILIGLIVFYKLALPRIQQARQASEAAQREEKIVSFIHSVAVKDGGSTDQPASGAEGDASDGRPEHLRVTPQVGEVEQELGAPQEYMNDFMGGEHLTWIGTRHKLVASFTKGQLYAVTLTNLKTGHGMQVFESSAQWRVF